MKQLTSDILKTRQHFKILDGMRGIAALSVVVFHFMEYVYSDYSKNFIGHGFLAVDFFFCLSGFVIAYAYDDRMGKMGAWEFFKSRLIRLHPLIIFGSVIGLLGFLSDPFSNDAGLLGFGKIFLMFVASVLLVPFPTMPERGSQLFNLNSPAWSLFFEYVANIFYAFVLYKIHKRYLLVLTILAAIPLCFVGYHSGTLMGGWSGNNFWDGFARVSYSFLAFIMPSFKWNWLTESLVVLFYFPFLVALGAGALLTPRFEKVCVFMGKISYPLYMTHYVAIGWFGHYYLSHQVGTLQLFFIVTAGTILLLGLAYVVMKFYDIPVRKYLTEKRLTYRMRGR